MVKQQNANIDKEYPPWLVDLALEIKKVVKKQIDEGTF